MTNDNSGNDGGRDSAPGQASCSGWWDGAPEQGINFWHPSEVLTFVAPGENTKVSRASLQEFLVEIFSQAGIKLDEKAFEPRQQNRDAEPLLIPRNGEPLFLQTVVLPDPPSTQSHDPDLVAPALKQAVDAAMAVNDLPRPPDAPDDIYRFRAATVNWLAMPFHGCPYGCPGGRPSRPPTPPPPPPIEPLPGPITKPGPTHEPFTSGEVEGMFGNSTSGAGIRVAVLDTWPERVKGQHNGRFRNRVRRKRDRVLERLGKTPGVTGPMIGQAKQRFDRVAEDNGKILVNEYELNFYDDYATPGDARCALHNCDHPMEEPHPMPGHGLFVADLIRDIAPGVTLSIYRVLNDWGMSDLRTIIHAVCHAINKAQKEQQPLIINLSLGIAVPLPLVQTVLSKPDLIFRESEKWIVDSDQLLQASCITSDQVGPWALESEKPEIIRANWASQDWSKGVVSRGDDDKVILNGLLTAFDLLFRGNHQAENVLVIAASGNDSCDHCLAYPRLPAVVEGVLGISAATLVRDENTGARLWQPARYSNADDIAAPDDGIAAFGGEVAQFTGVSVSAPIGTYFSDDIPGGNRDGFAQWSGTSFSTPIATAYAACIWSAARAGGASVPAKDVLEAIVRLPGGAPRAAIPLGYVNL